MCVCMCVHLLESVSVNTDMHMFGACGCVCVCMSHRERLVWSQTQWTHDLSADKCHQLQLLGGLCCRMGERGQAGVRVLPEGDGLQGPGGGVWDVGSQTAGGGDNTAMLNATSRPPLAIQVSAPKRPPVVSS